ncbi:MAG: hypothetical protein WBF77_05360 [Sulfurimonadaceae bacterium]
MRKSTLIVVSTLLPLLGQAAGMGLTVPIAITETERISYSNVNLQNTTYEYKPSVGLGFVFDTNIGKNKIFNYRLNLEYSLAEIDSSSRPYSNSFSKHKYNIVNTFGFGVVTERYVRFWVGPRLNIQYEHASGSSSIQTQNSYGVGLAAAAGLNVILGQKVSLAFDVDYHGALMFGGEDYKVYDGVTTGDTTYYTAYAGTNKGLTARLYLLFIFGEQYEERTYNYTDQSVIDHSL